MGGSASVDTAGVKAAKDKIEISYDVLSGIKQQLDEATQEARSGWKGKAADAFVKAMENFTGKIGEQLTVLNALAEKLGMAQQTYEATAQEQQDMVSAIEQALN